MSWVFKQIWAWVFKFLSFFGLEFMQLCSKKEPDINHKRQNHRSVVRGKRPNRWTDFQKGGTMWKPSYCWVFVNRFRDHICSGLLPVVKGLMVAFLGPRVSLLLHLLHFGGILIKLSKIQKQVFNLIFVIFGKCFQSDLSRTLRDPTNSLYRSSDRVGLRLFWK